MRTRVKICGITTPEDAVLAVDAGADALGLVFYDPSLRSVSVESAGEIAKSIPAFVMPVGLFVNADVEYVDNVLNQVPLQLLQFHGDESPAYCKQFGVPYIKALRVGREKGGLNGESLRQVITSYSDSRAVLLDTYQKGVAGGTGERFDWDLIPDFDGQKMSQKIILAGGLKAENVADAITSVKPYAVDVSGGVESAPGMKDAARIRAFLSAVYFADRS